MSETDNSKDGSSTQKPTDTRLSDEDITRLNDSILKKFPHLGKPQDATTKPDVTPTPTTATPTIATTEVDYKTKYETMEKEFRTGILALLPDDLKDKLFLICFSELDGLFTFAIKPQEDLFIGSLLENKLLVSFKVSLIGWFFKLLLLDSFKVSFKVLNNTDESSFSFGLLALIALVP